MDSGCIPCFCFGHSSECESSSNFKSLAQESTFNADNLDELTAFDSNGNSIYIGSDSNINDGLYVFSQDKDIWFHLPGNLFLKLIYYFQRWVKNKNYILLKSKIIKCSLKCILEIKEWGDLSKIEEYFVSKNDFKK